MEVKKFVDSLASTDPKTQSLLLGAIAKQYLFMFIIDVENNSIQDIYAPEYVVDFAAQYSTASDALMAFSVGYTMDAYLEETIKFSTWDNIIYELNTKGMTFIECQSKFRTWCRISYIAMERDELGNLKKFIVLNQVLDEEKRQELVLLDELGRAKIEGEIENNELKNKNRDISLVMTVLAEEYGNIYLVDPKYDTVEVIKQEDYIIEAVDEGEYLSVTYNTAFKRYVESCVYHKDQEEIYQVGCLENIKKLLKTVDSYTHNYRSINNGLHYFQFTFNKIEDGRIVVGFRNIDSIIEYEIKHRKQIDEARALAEHDALTGVYNRSILNQIENETDGSYNNICLMMVDVDNFKKINDQFGHDVGDIVIKKVAELLVNSSRESDTVVRYGGDEFLVIMRDMKWDNEKVLADKVKIVEEAMSEENDDNLPQATISAGIAFSEAGYCQELFNKADAALYKAKNAGRHTYSIDYDPVR